MKKIYFLLVAFIVTNLSFGQGSESFANSTATASYADNNFVGDNGVTWTFVRSRDANGDANGSGITLPALMLRRASDDSKVTSSTVSGGIGDFSVKLYKGFTGGGNRQVELFVNGVSQGTSTPFDDFNENIFTVTGIDISGDVVIEIRNITTKQVIVDDISWTGFTGTGSPSLNITAPSDGTVFPAGTTSVNLSVSTNNFTVDELPGNGGTGDGHIHWTINTDGAGAVSQPMKYNTNDESIAVVDGSSYVVEMTLVDNTHTPIVPAVVETVSFSVAYPCDLQLGTITTTCDTETGGVDTYTTTIDFTGGNTSTYTIDTGGVGSVAGDNPSTMASGQIVITGVNEGTDFSVNVMGDAGNSSCDIDRNIFSPTCVASTCTAVGSVIITEIMKNPNAVLDDSGEYFEVYNTTASPIDMQGWIISDADSDSHTIASSVIVPAMGYAVFGINANLGTNGGVEVNYEYTGINLSNSADEVQLECPASTIIDAVAYNNSTFPNTAGVAMELDSNEFDGVANDDGNNWGNSINNMGTGDFGTPGGANSVLSIANNTIDGFKVYPNPTATGYVNIITAANMPKEVTIFDMLGKEVLAQKEVMQQINISQLRSGIYIIKITENNKSATKRLIVR